MAQHKRFNLQAFDEANTEDVMLKLTEPFKVPLFEKILTFIKHPITQFAGHKLLLLLIIMIVSFSSAFFTAKLIQPQKSKYERINAEDYSPEKYYEILKQRHAEYKKLTPAALQIRWIELFSKFEYRLDGNSKYKQADCVGSVEEFLWSWGANVAHLTVVEKLKILKQYNEQGLNEERKSYNQVQPGDIVFIQIEEDRPSHVGIVFDKANGYIQIMDMNAKVKKMDFYDLKFDDKKIYAIYEIGLAFWAGDTFKDLFVNTKK